MKNSILAVLALAGAVSFLAGLYLVAGLAIVLMAAGALAVAYGLFSEVGK